MLVTRNGMETGLCRGVLASMLAIVPTRSDAQVKAEMARQEAERKAAKASKTK